MTIPAFSLRSGLVLLISALAGASLGLVLRPQAGSGVVKAGPGFPAPPAQSSIIGRPRSLPQTEDRLETLRLAGTPSRQIAAALALAEITSVDEIRDLLDNAHRFPSHSGEGVAIATLLKRWLELEPDGALAYCRQRQPEFLQRLIGTWGADHQEEAFTWVKAMPPGTSQQGAWMEICRTLAARDPAQALEMLGSTPGLDLRYGTWQVDSVMKGIVSQDVEGALRRLETLPPALLGAAHKAIATEMMKSSPDRAWQWIRQQVKPEALMGEALSASLRQDPAKALEFLKTLTSEEFQKVARESDYNWQVKDLSGFAALLFQDSGLNETFRQSMAQKIFSRGLWNDPGAAAALLPLIDAKIQPDHVRALINTWSKKDPAAARAWVESQAGGTLGKTGAEALEVSTSVAEVPDRNTPESLAAEFQQGQYVDRNDVRLRRLTVEQVGAMMGEVGPVPGNQAWQLLGSLSTANPTVGASWLESATLDQKSGPAAAQFSANWARSDPAAAGAWVKTLPGEGELARIATPNVARQFLRYDPAGVRSWLESLPAGPARDAAVKVITEP